MGSEWSTLSESSKVTLFSHGSLDHLTALDLLAERWLGPLSISIYTPGVDHYLATVYINYLMDCHPSYISRMSIHFGTPKALSAESLYEPIHFPSLKECPTNEMVIQTLLSYRTDNVVTFLKEVPYPHNILRNLARLAIRTDYLIMADMELIPNEHMFHQLEDFLRETEQKDCFNCAYVIPQFEKRNSSKDFLPKTKAALIALVHTETIFLRYQEIYKPFQHCVQGERWLDVPSSEGIEIAYPVTYSALCEPIVVTRSTAPGYLNDMQGFGFNRVAQVRV